MSIEHKTYFFLPRTSVLVGVTNGLDSTVAQAYAKELEGQIYGQVTSKVVWPNWSCSLTMC